jgi:hypothetical protein
VRAHPAETHCTATAPIPLGSPAPACAASDPPAAPAPDAARAGMMTGLQAPAPGEARAAVEGWLYPDKEELPADFEMPLWDHLEELKERVTVRPLLRTLLLVACLPRRARACPRAHRARLPSPPRHTPHRAALRRRWAPWRRAWRWPSALRTPRTWWCFWRRRWRRRGCASCSSPPASSSSPRSRWGATPGSCWPRPPCCTRSSPTWCPA